MASNDPPSPTVAAVEHTEGTSYLVAFGDPARYPVPAHQTTPGLLSLIPSYPAAGGENPYEPETGLLAQHVAELVPVDVSTAPPSALVTVLRVANALCVSTYDALRCVPERSRGVSAKTILHAIMESNDEVTIALDWMIRYDASPNGGGSLSACLLVFLYRMCHRDGTLQAFTTTSDLATISAPGEFDLFSLYFNLSARERTRLRVLRRDRRMPYVLSRQLILRKASRGGGPSGRFIRRNFLPDSDELFRVVVSFL